MRNAESGCGFTAFGLEPLGPAPPARSAVNLFSVILAARNRPAATNPPRFG
jgi:hypothetical protein